MYRFTILFFFFCILLSCSTKKENQPNLFEVIESQNTGLTFSNKLTSSPAFNLFKYMYFYNGAGVGAGDFNNDGLIDLFFSSNQCDNKLYLNKGALKFDDVTQQANIEQDHGWSTGVSVVDINNDGLLDIYICKVGHFEKLNTYNQLLICKGIDKNGIPHYTNEAHAYGLDFSGFSTQAAFFDYDLDGDLDMFLLNHAVHQSGNFAPRSTFFNTQSLLSGDRIYRRNSDNTFTDVTKQTHINSTAISYGLGIVIADINLDGYPDIYVGNDFHENDYMYINQKDGTFKEELNDHIMHTSQFSMGVDIADINNDALPEIMSVDMLASDPLILKRSLGSNDHDVFFQKIKDGYNYQYARNNLQFNCGNGMFSEVGLYAGIAATDWSWAPLWVDFDNDGLKDLFISNGIPKRMNDIDYINFISDNEIQQKILDNKIDETDEALIDKFPKIKLPNKFYKNTGQLMFHDLATQVGNDKSTYSNGSVYADFDNDGDLDIVVNNIDEPALLYRNNYSNPQHPSNYLDVVLHISGQNRNAIGSKVVVFAKDGTRVYEKFPVHGFQSSMEIPVHIGLDKAVIDSIVVIWPDNSYQKIQSNSTHKLELTYKQNLARFNYASLTKTGARAPRIKDITSEVKLEYLHKENSFSEFNREPLLPHLLSTESPSLAIADVNHDGLDDVFFGSARDAKSVLLLQTTNGKFVKTTTPALDADSNYEDVDACWTDINNDGNTDLIVASGGNEYFGEEEYLSPRVYLNDGKGGLVKKTDAFSQLFLTASTVSPVDFNGDGFMDLFIGARTMPWDYGKVPTSYLLQNDHTGKFINVTDKVAPGLAQVGFVTQSNWFDIDKDGDMDLLLALEWGPLTAFINNKGIFTKKVLSDKTGWWNFVLPMDVDNDGDIDLVAGNLGLNSRLKASEAEPVRLYYNDFDDNGKNEQVLTYYLNGKELPFANKAELEKQIPLLKKRFLYAKDLAEASLETILTKKKLSSSTIFSANYFSNAVFINDGKMNFSSIELPYDAQFSTFRDAVAINANGDNLPDLLLVGNYYGNNIELGRYDADFGTLLINKGKGTFVSQRVNGLILKGQQRHIKAIHIGGKEAFVLAQNNDSARVIQFVMPASK
ncbi:MAG: VCBS repeat-containing protein [Chitinophagaceae bacterium]|nr:VCBS repeat-containing protein [Chitinophagaceae bacterium]